MKPDPTNPFRVAAPAGGRNGIVSSRNVFAIVDDGNLPVEQYLEGQRQVLECAASNPGGIGCVVIIPAGGKPPSTAQRDVMKSTLQTLSPHVRGLVWVVEGRGFEAAAVRSVLTGLALFVRTYPTHVTTSTRAALSWLATKLPPSSFVIEDTEAVIDRARTGNAS